MTVKHRPELDAIAPYRQGPPAPPRDQPTYKLSSNETPDPPLPSVRQAIAAGLDTVNRYPAMAATDLVRALARRHQVGEDEIVLGAGSVEVASALIRATAGSGDEVVFAWRSFEAYPSLTIAAGATPVMVPLTEDLRHDLDAMAAAVTERTGCVFICNPNNPTGTVIGAAELKAFLDRVPSTVAVVIDEAYHQFDRDPDSPRGLDFYRRWPNVVVCHTFSKAYGLAGLRLGYAVAPPELAQQTRKVAIPFGVSDLAQRAGLASLAAEDELAQRVERIVSRRVELERIMADQGWRLSPSQANFLWWPTGVATAAAAAVLDRHGLVARVFPDEGVRITVAEAQAVEPIARAAGEIRALLETV
ncbi:MAG: histidinol-phosphate transaminase [Propionibacteriaceae bacterium]|jgi:histidinol-phosphate aminotransferase|nr:histidinol-phosphate transaminase [Propionibacteriaceae bacterium]